MPSVFALTNFSKNLLLDHLLRTASWSKPSALWWALFTTAPDETAASGIEVAIAGGYGRVQLSPSDANYTATQGGNTGASSGSSGLSSNSLVIQYAAPATNWGNAVAIAAMTASTAGSMYAWAPLQPAFQINAGDIAPAVPIGSLIFQIP
jgi:hypothetical protein